MKRSACLGLFGVLASGCGGRDPAWDAPTAVGAPAYGLTASVALIDAGRDRALFLTVPAGHEIEARAFAVGHHVVTSAVSAARDRLFVLSAGDTPRRTSSDQAPSLTVIDGSTVPRVVLRAELGDPLDGLALDPEGRWAVAYAASGVVVNPNELVLVDLDHPEHEPRSVTLRSRGGHPERLTFTSALHVPVGDPRRFLIAETDQDVTFFELVDLDQPESAQVTVTLPRTSTGGLGRPAEVTWHDGAEGDVTDARIAIRLQDDPNVVLLELGEPRDAEHDFSTTINVADVGGVPSSVEFVNTDGGLRVAALVPTQGIAALIDPTTSIVEGVELPKGYSRITRVTSSLAQKPDQADVALLYSPDAKGVAFWSLGRTTGAPFRSVEAYDLAISVDRVLDVPGAEHGALKLLVNPDERELYVFDLDDRGSSPLFATSSGFELSLSPDGERAWALRPGTTDVASVSLDDLHPQSVVAERDVYGVFDFARTRAGHVALLLHVSPGGALGATVLDAEAPDTARTTFYPDLLLGAP